MLSQLTRLQAIQLTTDTSLQELSARRSDLVFNDEERMDLLDSGASHAFRGRKLEEPLPELPVQVELAGGQVITLQQNMGETLMPVSQGTSAQETATILPMGALVQQLGCELT